MKVSSIAHWCTQTHQCCRAYTRTHSRLSCIHAHTLSLYLFIINNNFPADMKVIRAVSWIHWACSTSRYSKKIIPVLQLIISKAAQSVQRLEDWRYNAHAKQQTLLHFALYGRFSSPPFCLPNGCLLKIALTNGYFLRSGPAEAPILTTEESWGRVRWPCHIYTWNSQIPPRLWEKREGSKT